MTTTAVPNTIVIVCGVKQTSVPALIVRATAIVNAMLENTTMFPSPNPPLALVAAHIAELTNAESALRSRVGTRASRDEQRKVVFADVQQLHAYVQSLASKSPTDAAALADGAAMSVKRKGLHHKPDLAIRQPVSGTVKLAAKAGRNVKAYAWQYSLDGGTTWLDLPVTTQSVTTIHALIPGARISARVRRLTKAGMGDWSQPVSSLVT